jgi:hypothetical protein|tara:strand:+ start:5553 stop:6044 length:492 start_codon:yes stop_codon:yes gene_type:complete
MLTKELLSTNLITAYFIDNERKNIEVLTSTPNKKEVNAMIIPFNEDNEDYKNLIEYIDLDKLHEITYQKIKNDRAEFEAQIVDIAKKEGLIFDQNKIDTKFYPYLVKSIFEDKGNADHLFALKLALFEIDDVRDSDNMEQKTAIRKSKTKIEAIQAAINCLDT